MRRGATKVPKSNSMNEARMGEIRSQIGPQMCLELLFIPSTSAMPRKQLPGSSANCLLCETPHDTASVPLGRDLRDGPPLTEAMAALG